MFYVDEASLRMFSSVSKDDRKDSEAEGGQKHSEKPMSKADAKLNSSSSESNSEKFDIVSTREKNFTNVTLLQGPKDFDDDDYTDTLNKSDFFVQKDYKGIRGRRSTLNPHYNKKQYNSSRRVLTISYWLSEVTRYWEQSLIYA